jgi:hypothetical protein
VGTGTSVVAAAAFGGVRTGLAAVLLSGRNRASAVRMSTTVLRGFSHKIFSFGSALKRFDAKDAFGVKRVDVERLLTRVVREPERPVPEVTWAKRFRR